MSDNDTPTKDYMKTSDDGDFWKKVLRKVRVNPENESVSIMISMEQLSPDRVQYKPYGLGYTPNHIYVEVTIPLEEVVRYYKETDEIVLTPRGAVMIADQLATAIEENYDEFRGRNKRF